jgi:2-polyprenyl-6-methoxyphenol hydroxylase-like FAD-dependent oxidoreductase
MVDRVLIVGAGPTGLTAALELSRLGIPVRIVDKQAAPPATSCAVGVQACTLELLELRGLADEMVRLGNPGLAASFYGGDKRVFRLDFTRIDSRYHYLLFISQAETECILRTAVERQGGLDRARRRAGWDGAGHALPLLLHARLPGPVPPWASGASA